MGKAVPNTLLIGGVTLVVTVVISVLVAYLVVRRSNVMNQVIDTLSMLPYVIPGSVVGISLVMSSTLSLLLFFKVSKSQDLTL